MKNILLLFFAIFMISSFDSFSQDLYSARGYWNETKKETYVQIKRKQSLNRNLTQEETAFLEDYENYLDRYFQRLTNEEKRRYEEMKDLWDESLLRQQETELTEEFEWRIRDRSLLFLYGAYYGLSMAVALEIDGTAAGALPLITGGLYMLGPTFNPKKYEGITRTTIRAGNTGKFLGLINGWSLGLAVAGESDNLDKFGMILSSVGSIAMGEVGFQMQKRQNLSAGYIGVIRHYGILCPWIALSVNLATENDNANLAGVSLLAGGVAGYLIGNGVANRYDYTGGDATAFSSLSLITTGIGFTIVADALDKGNSSDALFLVPALGSLAGSLVGQYAVKGAYFSKKQGSNLSLASAGGAAVGMGVALLIESDSPAVWVGIPSAFALVTHQILFYSYKRDNMARNSLGFSDKKGKYLFSMDINPENYFINKSIPAEKYAPLEYARMQQPVVQMRVTF